MPESDNKVYADVNIHKRFSDMWPYFEIFVYSKGEKVAYRSSYRPTYDWCATSARKLSKRMVNREERRLKKGDESHIRNFKIGKSD